MTDEKTPDVSALDEQSEIALRESLIIEAQRKYHELVNYIRNVPIPQMAFHQALLFTDTGMLWVREALSRAPFIEGSSNAKSSSEQSVAH